MPTTSDYLTQLEQDREDLVDNLETKGITGLSGDETFTELVPEVLNIPSGGGSGLDWSAIGYSGEPNIGIQDGYDYAVEVKNNWVPATSLQFKFNVNVKLMFMPLVDTSSTTSMRQMFGDCESLLFVPILDTSSVTNMQNMFQGCGALKTIPLLDTSSVTNMTQMFASCRSLRDVPILDTSSVTNMQSMFTTCFNLSDASLDNILQMCINATSYNGTKTLSQIGFLSGYGQTASRIQALPHYQDFIDAGWTIGYS